MVLPWVDEAAVYADKGSRQLHAALQITAAELHLCDSFVDLVISLHLHKNFEPL